MKGSYENQTVIITGASSGVGEGVAHHFAANGANLVLVARNKEKLYQVRDFLKQKTRVIAISMDVSKFDDCQNLDTSIDMAITRVFCFKKSLT